jgi:cell division protein DivIC
MNRRAAVPDVRRRRSPEVWEALSRIVMVLIALAGGVLLFFAFSPEWAKMESMKRQKEELLREKHRLELEQKLLQREVDLLQNDPEYVEMIARDKLDLMSEGETVFRLEPRRESGTPVSETVETLVLPGTRND